MECVHWTLPAIATGSEDAAEDMAEDMAVDTGTRNSGAEDAALAIGSTLDTGAEDAAVDTGVTSSSTQPAQQKGWAYE